MAKRVAIVQSNYIPWKGYFDLIASVDEFILFDTVQYTRRDWRNRNKIKTKDGLKWLTIPVDVKGKFTQTIEETRIADDGWATEHLAMIKHSYARAPFFVQYKGWVEALYAKSTSRLLSEVNYAFIRAICDELGVETKLSWSHDYPASSERNERLVDLCLAAGATHYLSGPSAKTYLDAEMFEKAGITVEFKSYDGYPEYPQLFPPFEHAVTVLDVIFSVGPRAREFIRAQVPIERN